MHYELSIAARKYVNDLLVNNFPVRYPVAWENASFTPPADGSIWLKYNYTEVDTVTYGLSRKCKYYVGMVQISVFFSPGTGIDRPRQIANQLAESIVDGTMLDSGTIDRKSVV